MKRILVIITIASILALMLSTFVFADESSSVPQWFQDMISWRKAQVDQAVQNNTITQDQAQLYKERIDQMEKFHTENGFPSGMGFGACHGGNSRSGFGPGMMGY
jgi:hypothetical protein